MNEPHITNPPVPGAEFSDAEDEPPAVEVLVADEQAALSISPERLVEAVQAAVAESPYTSGSISIAVVDDPTIHELNRHYLQHDYPTDVLSFVLEDAPPRIEGELVVSTDTASANAAEYGWSAAEELLLYVIHGTLHLVGFLDKHPDEVNAMRAAEGRCLARLNIAMPPGFADPPSDALPEQGSRK
jgi:probable rRNA maturation factor